MHNKLLFIIQYGYNVLSNLVNNPISDVDAILMHVCKISYNELALYKMGLRDIDISNNEIYEIYHLYKLRAQLIPIQYLLGNMEFCNINLKMQYGVFIPRVETEIMVEYTAKLINENFLYPKIYDLCSGSGNIALSLAKFLNELSNNRYQINCIEKDKNSYELLCKNIKSYKYNIDCYNNDILNDYQYRELDCIIINPPYLLHSDYQLLSNEIINYEPYNALVSDNINGIQFICNFLFKWQYCIKRFGFIAIEHGDNQSESIINYLDSGILNILFNVYHVGYDLTGRKRFLILQRI